LWLIYSTTMQINYKLIFALNYNEKIENGIVSRIAYIVLVALLI